MNRQKQSQFWYLGSFLFSIAVILADSFLFDQVRRYVSRTYQAYLHSLYLVGVFSLLMLLILCKNRANIGMQSNRILLNSICVAGSFLLIAAIYLQLPWLLGANSFTLSGMLTISCIADLVYSCCRKGK